jgi:hypothetical protein
LFIWTASTTLVSHNKSVDLISTYYSLLTINPPASCSLFGWQVADGWCWFVLREEYCWLVVGGWFVLREKHCWLVAYKPSEQAVEGPPERGSGK